MDSKRIIEAVGGRKAVITMTGLTRGRISQWATENEIPAPWLKFFQAKFPKLPWANLLSDPQPGRRESTPSQIDRRTKDGRTSTTN